MKPYSIALLIVLWAVRALAQDTSSLATPTGHEVNVSVGAYDYQEPGDLNISIHGAKLGGGYTGTWSLNKEQHVFIKADGRGSGGSVTYDGWCAPFFITPYPPSPNGYALDLGDYSPCSESGDADWNIEGRGLIGKDFIGSRWGLSPEAGLGVRHLSNGTSGIPNYRTDEYLYLPLALTARTMMTSQKAVSFSVEYDHLLHGWQKTRDSQLGGGDVPATPTTPAFTIDGFTDVSFDQHDGWAVRASAKFQMTRRWSVEPAYIYWRVQDSNVSYETATFTVQGITANQQLGAYEPFNVTHEFAVKLVFHP